jgi:hypothetical protein
MLGQDSRRLELTGGIVNRRSFLESLIGLLAALAAMTLPRGASRPPRDWKRASHWRRLAG